MFKLVTSIMVLYFFPSWHAVIVILAVSVPWIVAGVLVLRLVHAYSAPARSRPHASARAPAPGMARRLNLESRSSLLVYCRIAPLLVFVRIKLKFACHDYTKRP